MIVLITDKQARRVIRSSDRLSFSIGINTQNLHLIFGKLHNAYKAVGMNTSKEN